MVISGDEGRREYNCPVHKEAPGVCFGLVVITERPVACDRELVAIITDDCPCPPIYFGHGGVPKANTITGRKAMVISHCLCDSWAGMQRPVMNLLHQTGCDVIDFAEYIPTKATTTMTTTTTGDDDHDDYIFQQIRWVGARCAFMLPLIPDSAALWLQNARQPKG